MKLFVGYPPLTLVLAYPSGIGYCVTQVIAKSVYGCPTPPGALHAMPLAGLWVLYFRADPLMVADIKVISKVFSELRRFASK